jgi:hypothetical protein
MNLIGVYFLLLAIGVQSALHLQRSIFADPIERTCFTVIADAEVDKPTARCIFDWALDTSRSVKVTERASWRPITGLASQFISCRANAKSQRGPPAST